jgi:hypothetical protein
MVKIAAAVAKKAAAVAKKCEIQMQHDTAAEVKYVSSVRSRPPDRDAAQQKSIRKQCKNAVRR